jgi:hypothetical protein
MWWNWVQASGFRLHETGNSVGDPRFVDAVNDNYSWQQSSAAVGPAIRMTANTHANDGLRVTASQLDRDRNGVAVADVGALESIP